jgi:hypothetical protein
MNTKGFFLFFNAFNVEDDFKSLFCIWIIDNELKQSQNFKQFFKVKIKKS